MVIRHKFLVLQKNSGEGEWICECEIETSSLANKLSYTVFAGFTIHENERGKLRWTSEI